jgi:hypothetical protein
MRRTVPLALSLVFCTDVQAQGQGQSHYSPYTGLHDGQWLLDLCDPPDDASNRAERGETCMSYTLGIHDGYYATITAQLREAARAGHSTNASLICNERQMTLYELRMLVIKYLKAQPNLSNRAHHYVLAALQMAYPCARR